MYRKVKRFSFLKFSRDDLFFLRSEPRKSIKRGGAFFAMFCFPIIHLINCKVTFHIYTLCSLRGLFSPNRESE